MNIMDIKEIDVINGIGLRVSIFVAGCDIHCKGCFNKDSWDFNAGRPFTDEDLNRIISLLNDKAKGYKGLSILGGEPTCHKDEVIKIIKTVRANCPDIDIWLWSGRTMIVLSKDYLDLIKLCDYIVVGPYLESEKNLSLKFRGSDNQKIIKNVDGYIYEEIKDEEV